MMQIGDVDFDTAATDDYNFVFAGVADPDDVVHSVDQATGARTPPARHGLGERPAPPQPPDAGRRALKLGGGGLEAGGGAQRVGPVGALPGEVVVLAAEVAVGGGLLEDRPVQVEVAGGRRRGAGRTRLRPAARSRASGSLPVPKVSTISETGWATPIA